MKDGIFKYKAYTCNDSYVEVVTAGRDQDDSSTTRKIVIHNRRYNNGCRNRDSYT